MTALFASNITILNFSNEPDEDGMILPVDAYAEFRKPVLVVFDSAKGQTVVGEATVKRVGNKLVADLFINTKMRPVSRAIQLISQLYPAACFMVKYAVGAKVQNLEVSHVLLTPHGNIDRSIRPLMVVREYTGLQ